MQRFVKGKLTAAMMAIALTLAASAAAFADWPSFQNHYENNGVITTGVPLSQPMVTAIHLGTNGTAYSGVDTTSVISRDMTNGDVAYTLYDGGEVSGASGGARLAVTNLPGRASVDYQIDDLADNAQQLSTPFLDTASKTLYAATTYYEDRLDIGTINFDAGTTTVTRTITVPSDYYDPELAFTFPNSIAAGNFSATATLSGSGGTFDFGPGYSGGDGKSYTAYKNGSSLIPAGNNYTLTVTVTNNTGSAITNATMKFLVSRWHLWNIDVSGEEPDPTPITIPAGMGYGQANTPIEYTSDRASIYFGIYEGDRSYYKYTIGGALERFNAQDDFYWAGALVEADDSQIIFGSDSGKLYVQDNSDFETSLKVINLKDTSTSYGKADAGKVRSTIVDGDYSHIYFTSSGTGDQAYLWAVRISTIATNPNVLSRAIPPAPNWDKVSSVSTPVVSEHDYLYVGLNEYEQKSFQGDGQVLAFDLLSEEPFADIPSTVIFDGVGESVSASPIVKTSGYNDYVYFTTNSANGAGYCYLFDIDNQYIARSWKAPNSPANPYSLQGMAADGGCAVWGDDGNYLYIACPQSAGGN